MGLKDFYPGDAAFPKFSVVFSDKWETFSDKEKLLALVRGNIELARPIAFRVGTEYEEWLSSAVPALRAAWALHCPIEVPFHRTWNTPAQDMLNAYAMTLVVTTLHWFGRSARIAQF